MTGKPTPGPWQLGQDGDVIWGAEWNGEKVLVATVPFTKESRVEADARLMAEAGTVYHETGLTPRQLAEQRAELMKTLAAARNVESVLRRANDPTWSEAFYAEVSAIVDKAEGVQ